MIRNVTMEEISDGRRYTANDMVKADCRGCEGCSACCQGMGKSVIVDPFDLFCLCNGLQVGAETLLTKYLELNVVDGVILPNLKMTGKKEACLFLNEEGRCEIHSFRPGFCRLFPLGRVYEEDGFRYFLQIHECPKTDRTKVKVKKWVGISEFDRYENFIMDWHRLLKRVEETVKKDPESGEAKALCVKLLQEFYLKPYDSDGDFYEQFRARLAGF